MKSKWLERRSGILNCILPCCQNERNVWTCYLLAICGQKGKRSESKSNRINLWWQCRNLLWKIHKQTQTKFFSTFFICGFTINVLQNVNDSIQRMKLNWFFLSIKKRIWFKILFHKKVKSIRKKMLPTNDVSHVQRLMFSVHTRHIIVPRDCFELATVQEFIYIYHSIV